MSKLINLQTMLENGNQIHIDCFEDHCTIWCFNPKNNLIGHVFSPTSKQIAEFVKKFSV